MEQIQYQYDVIIVGGGFAGLSLCCLLGRDLGLKIACVDQASPSAHRGGDERTTAISYGSSKILEQAGVWDDLMPHGCPIEDIEILDGHSPVLLRLLSAEMAGKAFGWVIPNRHIRKTLMEQVAQMPNVSPIAPAKVKDFAVDAEQARVTLDDGRVLSAKLIVGADGRQSAVRDFMDVPVRSWSYKQQAVVCFIAHEHPHENRAVEHFWAQGPFAILPMMDLADGRHCSSLVWIEHAGPKGSRGQSSRDMSAADFRAVVAEKFPSRYGNIVVLEDKRLVYPLSLVHAARYIAPRMVLVADAAHGIHPVAGQGLNLGFRDIACLAGLIDQARKGGQDIGAAGILEAYQRKRRPDNMAMVAATDALVRLFSTDFLPIQMARKLGLRAVSRFTPVKRYFMRKAMGE